jgi:predicted cupin superfamily sugar epimerase
MFFPVPAALAAISALPSLILAIPIEKRTAQDIINKLNLEPNVEKGYYRQTFQDPDTVNGRSVSTLIYYLLEGSDGDSRWHRVTDAAEVWHYYAGAPLTLSLSNNDGKAVEKHALGADIFDNQAPQVVIPKNKWQSARSHGSWTLVGTTGKMKMLIGPSY